MIKYIKSQNRMNIKFQTKQQQEILTRYTKTSFWKSIISKTKNLNVQIDEE